MRVTRVIAGMMLITGLSALTSTSAMGASHFDGDSVEVTTDKAIYAKSQPVVVLLKYTNVGNESQLLDLGPGTFDARVYVNDASKEGDQHIFSGTMGQINKSLHAGLVEAHSSKTIAGIRIPANTLPAGYHEIFVIFNLSSATTTPTPLLQARPSTVIEVR